MPFNGFLFLKLFFFFSGKFLFHSEFADEAAVRGRIWQNIRKKKKASEKENTARQVFFRRFLFPYFATAYREMHAVQV